MDEAVFLRVLELMDPLVGEGGFFDVARENQANGLVTLRVSGGGATAYGLVSGGGGGGGG